MPFRKIFFEKDQPFHILSRAVEGREIFKEEADCYRFIFQIYAFNIGKPARNLSRLDVTKSAQALLEGEEVSSKFIIKEHLPFVYFLDFSLVINHHHLYLVANIENSIPFYMQKLNGGFARYFNLKYDRQNSLFGNRYKSIAVTSQFQSDAVSRYISVINPLDVFQPGWRKEGLKNFGEAFKFLENFQFSSFPDKIGKRSSKILAPQSILEKYLAGLEEKKGYENFVKDFLKQKLKIYGPFFLE